MSKQEQKTPTQEESVQATDSSTEIDAGETRYPALPLAVETLKLAYEDINAGIESIHTRAGIGLTLIVTALAFVTAEIKLDRVQMFDSYWWLAALGYLFALGLVAGGGWFLQKAILTKSAISGYSTQELHTEEWQKSVEDFHLKELSNFRQGAEKREELNNEKAGYFNRGLQLALLGMALFFCLQLIGSLIVLKNAKIPSATVQTLGGKPMSDPNQNPTPAQNPQPQSQPAPTPPSASTNLNVQQRNAPEPVRPNSGAKK
jgi:hypothetical protein